MASKAEDTVSEDSGSDIDEEALKRAEDARQQQNARSRVKEFLEQRPLSNVCTRNRSI